MKKFCVFALFLLLCTTSVFCDEGQVALDKAPIDQTDLASLQRGVQIFMNYCSGCHGLKYLRYKDMAKDIGIVDQKGKVLTDAVKSNLMFVGDRIEDQMRTSMTKGEGSNWFGIAPPDLSLEVRYRGADWVYTYLRSFYLDPKKVWGVNNRVYPDVAMPHVLYNVQKSLSPKEYDQFVGDLVNFLVYAAEPHQIARKRLGVWVLIFLGIFFVFAVLLKREYWKDIK